MSDDPVFVYAAVYADRADADADYDALLDLHSADLVGSYDVALVYKDDEGKVHVTKHEKPTQHGAWTGAAVGALVGIIFPPAVLGAAVVGAAAGGGIGHAMGGMSRSDAKELGDAARRGPGRAGRDRQVARAGAARQGADAGGEERRDAKSTPTARNSRRNSTRCPSDSHRVDVARAASRSCGRRRGFQSDEGAAMAPPRVVNSTSRQTSRNRRGALGSCGPWRLSLPSRCSRWPAAAAAASRRTARTGAPSRATVQGAVGADVQQRYQQSEVAAHHDPERCDGAGQLRQV